jgi:hypothetical protein
MTAVEAIPAEMSGTTMMSRMMCLGTVRLFRVVPPKRPAPPAESTRTVGRGNWGNSTTRLRLSVNGADPDRRPTLRSGPVHY